MFLTWNRIKTQYKVLAVSPNVTCARICGWTLLNIAIGTIIPKFERYGNEIPVQGAGETNVHPPGPEASRIYDMHGEACLFISPPSRRRAYFCPFQGLRFATNLHAWLTQLTTGSHMSKSTCHRNWVNKLTANLKYSLNCLEIYVYML